MTSSSLPPEPDVILGSAGGDPTPPPAPEAPATFSSDAEERLLRALADLDNLRKRFQREVQREREAERMRVAALWLPVLDDLDRAVEHVSDDRSDGLIDGLRAVRDHAQDVLSRLGYPRFEDLGDIFDPARHDAVSVIDADEPSGTIVGVVRPGYGTAEVILRPAAVVVARS